MRSEGLNVIDSGCLRKRLKTSIEAAGAPPPAARRAAAATRGYEVFLEEHAMPAFRTFANVLRAEGIRFEVITPLDGVRLVPDARDVTTGSSLNSIPASIRRSRS